MQPLNPDSEKHRKGFRILTEKCETDNSVKAS